MDCRGRPGSGRGQDPDQVGDKPPVMTSVVPGMPARLFLSSGDLVADRRFDFARDLQLKGDIAAAADLLLQATELAPGFASAWFTLGEVRERLRMRDAGGAGVLKTA